MIAQPGIFTFLFTDIEGSTRRWEADPDAMGTALEAHDEVLRTAVVDCGGVVFKHTGDGMCAAFTSPRSAADAAVAAQRVLALPVRMGLATGEAELREGDYFGAVLNRASRVMSAGHGGQILIDGVTADLLSGVDLRALGTRRLRDIAKPVQLFQVNAVGLAGEFPSLKTVDGASGNVRPPTTSFIGRESEMADLQAALSTHRLVTLTGVGGVGKTRLALEAATRAASAFPDGVWVIELAAIGDPGTVPDAVAEVLGIAQQPGMSVAASLAAALTTRTRLLVFDNCEHVLDAAADMIDTILASSDTVRVLATSREGLRAADEQLLPVPSLDVTSSAATLFVDRASAVAPAIALDAADRTVGDICRRLDGIPLAIELAASRMQSMTVSELHDRLDDRFRLLVGSRRGLERHQTLRHAVAWSYDLLDDAERVLLQRCSVFAGGFDLQAATAVGGADDLTTLDLLDSLVRKSLVVADRSSERTRFSMLETLRQFAEEHLAASGAADATRARHARYFADRESDVFALWDGPRQREAYSWVTLELANLRAAFRWAADHDDLGTAATIAHYAAFVSFWGDRHEPVRWAEELIAPARAVQHRRLAQLYAMAALCFTAGRFEDSIKYADAGEKAVTSGCFDAVRKEAEASISGVYAFIGQPEHWVEWCRGVLARRPETYIHAQAILVLALMLAGADDEAVSVSEPLLAVANASENPNLAAFALFAYGAARRERAPEPAYPALRRALTMARDSGSLQTASTIASMSVPLALTQGDSADALDDAVWSLRYYYDSGNVYMIRNPLIALAFALDRLGHYEPAATICGFAVTDFTKASMPEIELTIANLKATLGDATYESLCGRGEHMAAGEIVRYAFEQIDLARTELP